MARSLSQRKSYAAARSQTFTFPVVGEPGDVIEKGEISFIAGQYYRLMCDVRIPTKGDTEGYFKLAKHNT